MNYNIKISDIHLLNTTLKLTVKGELSPCGEFCRPKVILHFDNGLEDRYLPMVFKKIETTSSKCSFEGTYRYQLDKVFWKTSTKEYEGVITLDLFAEDNLIQQADFTFNETGFKIESEKYDLEYNHNSFKLTRLAAEKTKSTTIKKVISSLFGGNSKESDDFGVLPRPMSPPIPMPAIARYYKKVRLGVKRAFTIFCYNKYKKKDISDNLITFMSERSNELIDNQYYLYNELKKDDSLEFAFNLDTRPYTQVSLFQLRKFAKLVAKSKVIIIDEYVPALYFLHLREETKFIQIWHACGAFKTVGFSRLGKLGAPIQSRRAHRNYDYSIVSSEEIRRWYAEAFGLSMKNVLSLGVPRTDIFFDQVYKDKITKELEEKYPQIVGKKVILFAPTFRGERKDMANYPFHKIDFNSVIDQIGEDYVILVKKHPFILDDFTINEEYKDSIIDVTDYPQINDLLFVTNVLISDYSSVIFEASLLDIPMLFYAFDLKEYIKERDFYYDFVSFVPGKIVFNQKELISSIENNDFEQEKIQKFKERFFTFRDGKSTERIAELVKNCVK